MKHSWMNWRLTFPTLDLCFAPQVREQGERLVYTCQVLGFQADQPSLLLVEPSLIQNSDWYQYLYITHQQSWFAYVLSGTYSWVRLFSIQAVHCFLICMSLSLTQGPQFLNTSLFKRTDGFSFTRWTLKGNFKSGRYHCLFGWIVMQVSVPLRCYSNPAWFFYPFNFLLMPHCPYNKNKRPAKRQVFCD